MNDGYSPSHITAILDMYISVHSGCYGMLSSEEEWGNKPGDKAPYELAIGEKVDVDQAIDSMGVNGRWNAYCKYIENVPAGYGLNNKQYAVAQYPWR
jgi:hypothetical protein